MSITYKRIKEVNGHPLKTEITVSKPLGLLRFDVVSFYKGCRTERVCYSADKIVQTIEIVEVSVLREQKDATTYVEELLASNGFAVKE